MLLGPVRRRTAARVVGAIALVGALVLWAAPVGAQDPEAPTTEEFDSETSCTGVKPVAEFLGRVTTTNDELVTYEVVELRSGELNDGLQVVEYPSKYNVRYLRVDQLYLVGITVDPEFTKLLSFVPTGSATGCPTQSTRLADGTPIDTGVISGIKEKGRPLLVSVAAVVLGALVVLVLLGRFFDRKSRYRPKELRSRRARKQQAGAGQ